MSEIKTFFNKIELLNQQILQNKFMKKLGVIINNQINMMFPKLNLKDINIIQNMSIYIHNSILKKIIVNEDIGNINQFTQNNHLDIKSIILMLIPFVSDDNNNIRLNNLVDLNQILYRKENANSINESVLDKDMIDARGDEFFFSNFAMGLLNKSENILKLIDENGDKLIYKMIYHNFISLLESINMCTNKYYVNWINVVPILEKNLKEEEVYKRTIKGIEDYKKLDIVLDSDNTVFNFIEFQNNYNGLWFGDFYNVIRKGYYQSIKSVKWLIFNRFNKSKNKNQYYLQVLDDKLNLNSHINSTSKTFVDLTEEQQFDFKTNLNKLVTNLNDNEDNVIYVDTLKQLLIYMVNGYTYRQKISNDNTRKFEFETTDELIDEGKDDDLSTKNRKKFNDITLDNIIETIKSIGEVHIWDYLKESIDYFQSTVYSTYLIVDNNVDKPKTVTNMIDHNFYTIQIDGNDTGINLKNLYNISKILSHDIDWNLNYENYIGLSFGKKHDEFMSDFLDNDIDWLKISKNLEIETQFNDNKSKDDRLAEIKKGWDSYKINFIFTYLIRRGILSKFVTAFDITSKRNSESERKRLMKGKFSDNNWGDAYYYLNNQKYSKLDKIRHDDGIDTSTKKYVEETYFDILGKHHNWYSFYAMDWVIQIKFFHTYINHQVMYVTGSTGTGKSTQVPKLLMYALKMIDYKDNGSIICTQPRIPPTINNAERISLELGVPIKVPSGTISDKINTDNFYCQYKYQGNQHTTYSKKDLSLKIVTDGTLFEEIKNNQLMKMQVPGKSNNKHDITYSHKNKYDILIIDEAHEHNSNMDLILSLARNTCYFNNSIRLVIVSATMDDDEPIYRSYFKIINDNLIYPLKQPVAYMPFMGGTTNFLPQTIFMERRFHMSKPGETTQHVITEIYRDLEEKLDDQENSKIAQKESYKVINEICNSSTSGEILLFSTGQGEIIEAVKYLNETLPSGVIALPYFSAMNKKYKDIVEKIEKNINKIKNKRTNIYEEWGPTFIEDSSVPNGIYNRAVIVATNVAEASITIKSLVYVIDNGFAKEAFYDESIGNSALKVEKISEASRVQRKGRVGRTSSGIVYYMYKKDARKKIMPKYKINQMNHELIFNQLASKIDADNTVDIQNKLIYPKWYDPHLSAIFLKIYEQIKSNKKLVFTNPYYGHDIDIKKTNVYKLGIYDIINKQFTSNEFIDTGLIPDIYIPNPYLQDTNVNRPQYLSTLEDGINMSDLFDLNGTFYLIHPKEDKIIRNCANEIIKLKGDQNSLEIKIDELDLLIFNQTLFNLQSKLQIVDINAYEFNQINNDLYKMNNIKMKRTLLGEKISELVSKTSLAHNLATTLFYAYGHSNDNDKTTFNDTIMIIALLQACDYSVKKLARLITTQMGYKIPDFLNLRELFFTNRSDIESLYKITQVIKSRFNQLKIFNLDKKYYNTYKKEFDDTVLKYEKISNNNKINSLIYRKDFDPPKEYDNGLWNKLTELKNNSQLKNDTGFQNWLESTNSVKNSISNDLKKYEHEIKTFCDNNYLNYDIINTFFIRYLNLKLNIDTIDKNENSKSMSDNPFKWLDANYKINFTNNFLYMTNLDKIIHSFLSGNSINVLFKTDFNKPYTVMTTTNTTIIKPLSKNSNDVESFVKNPSPIVLFLNRNSKTNFAEVITNITINDLIESNPLFYNPTLFKNIYVQKNLLTNLPVIIEFKGVLWEDFIFKLKNNWNMDSVVWKNSNNNLNNKDHDTRDNDTNLNNYIKNLYAKVIRLNY
jgi:hypothetical protein